jgi:hypothetical protein
MLRDNLVGLIEPMLNGAGDYPLALRTNWKQSSDDRPACLENPRPAGAESTLTENVASPFHAEPEQLFKTVTRHKLADGATLALADSLSKGAPQNLRMLFSKAVETKETAPRLRVEKIAEG